MTDAPFHDLETPLTDARYSFDRVFDALLVTTGVVLWSANVLAMWPFTVDDAYITYRHARHFALTGLSTFNVTGPPAEGATSFLWTCVVALAHLATDDVTVVAKSIGVALMALAFVAAVRLARRWAGAERADLGRRGGALAVMLLGAWPAISVYAVSGMETSLGVLLALVFVERLLAATDEPSLRRWSETAVVAFALGLARPEQNLFVALALGIVFATHSASRRRMAIATAIWCVVPGIAYLAWRAHAYGVVMPLPFHIKLAADTGRWPGWGMVRSFALEILGPLSIPIVVGAVALGRRALPVLPGALAILIFFSATKPMMDFSWRFLAPVAALLFVAAGCGLARLGETIFANLPHALRGVAIAGLAVAIVVQHAGARTQEIEHYNSYATGLRQAHIPLGRFLAEHAAPRDPRERLLVISDAGSTPYYSGWRTIDTFGLNEPRIAI
ncbi:MAG: hypothetical protein KJ042_01385, partial [Deltaproteobacteria bacterium]|nr:hypothetical protein [Deltaproteobacteria bacterium]